MERSDFIKKWSVCKEKGFTSLECYRELKKDIPEEEINKHLADLFINSGMDFNTFTEEGITSTSIGDVPEQQAIKDKSKDYLNDGTEETDITLGLSRK